VFISGKLAGYLDGLERLRALDLAVLCPGHGPPVWDVQAKLDEYIAHRLDRERRLVAALDRGLRSEDELLDAAWDDAPEQLRPFAAVSLRAHLEKLRAEGRA
jgi:glyoxylase-like metal-dependent hydrolase (beta-lactamase superfamily II)